jgi:SAM-dependent methyltransferase
MPIPLACQMIYGDVFSGEVLKANLYDGQDSRDIIEPHVIVSFDSLEVFADKSLDFIVACHVIEHTANPIRAIVEGVRKLRKGGSLALVVPDMEKTFDRNRPVTPLDHLIRDYVDPSRERDKQNFQEFYKLAFPAAPDEYEGVWKSKWAEGFPIHYHTWDFQSFGQMIDWIRRNECALSAVKSHHPVQVEEAIEFYYLLTV